MKTFTVKLHVELDVRIAAESQAEAEKKADDVAVKSVEVSVPFDEAEKLDTRFRVSPARFIVSPTDVEVIDVYAAGEVSPSPRSA